MLPKPFLSHHVERPIESLCLSPQHSSSQHESDDDAGSPVDKASAPTPPSPGSNYRQMAHGGPHPWSGGDQDHIHNIVRVVQGAGLDTDPRKTDSVWPNGPAFVARKNHHGRQRPSPGPVAQPMAFKDQDTRLVPLNTPKSQTMESFDDDPFFLPSSTPTAADDAPLPTPSADTETEWTEINGPTSFQSLSLELRKKIYAHLLIVDMVSVEEEATTILPGSAFGFSLGIYPQILRANKQIHAEASDVLYKANDWLSVAVEDEATLEATFRLLKMRQRRVIDASPTFAPFMEIKMCVGQPFGFSRHGERHRYFQSRDPVRKFILDLASFNRLCNHRIYMNAHYREPTHLQVWHRNYHPHEPKHTALNRGRVEQMLARVDSKGITRWCPSDGQSYRTIGETIDFITGSITSHEARPQTPRHIFQHVSTMAISAEQKSSNHDSRGVRFLAMECLRYVHASTQDWRNKNPGDIAANIRDLFAQIGALTIPLVLHGIELTISLGNLPQARDASVVLKDMLWKSELNFATVAAVTTTKLLKMTTHEYACLILLTAKAWRAEGRMGHVVDTMEKLFATWSDIEAHTVRKPHLLAKIPHLPRIVVEQRRWLARYNYEVHYKPLLELSVEQFLRMGEAEKGERAEVVGVNILDYRLHNWMGEEESIDAVGPCWVWPRDEEWVKVLGKPRFGIHLPDYL